MKKTSAETPILDGMWERFTKVCCPFSYDLCSYSPFSKTDRPHFHDFSQIWYCVSGHYTHFVGDTSYECTEDTLIIIPPGIPHHYVISDSPCTLIQLNIMFSLFKRPYSKESLSAVSHLFLPSFSDTLGFEKHICTHLVGNSREIAKNIFLELTEIYSSLKVQHTSAISKLLCRLFGISEFEIPDQTFKKIQPFVEYKYIPIMKTVYFMNRNFNRPIHRDELISMSHICQTNYFKLIKRTIGCTYSQYLQMLRVRHAIMLCTFSTFTFSYISDICGFGDLTYMEKQFRAFFNDIPTNMRARRGVSISSYPHMIKSREEYESVSPLFNDL